MSITQKRVFSGIQPTGKITLGNYIGAILQWTSYQRTHETFFCIVDLHTLTLPEDMTPTDRRQKSLETTALYLACGIDPSASSIFIQSQVYQHTELAWVLNCVTPVGWLERMTQYKSKGERRESVGAGLLNYPVLMAADILLYNTDLVPVGDDQKQHVELACDIAQRFNHLFGETFRLPQVVIRKQGARIMGLDDPTTKMSKSIGLIKSGHAIGLLDSEKVIKKTIMGATTDSGNEFRFDHASPGIKNLMSIGHALTGESFEDITDRFNGQGYGHLKKWAFEVVMSSLAPVQKRFNELWADQRHLHEVLEQGLQVVRPIAEQTMRTVKEATGLQN